MSRENSHEKREPLFHIVRRGSIFKVHALLIRIIAILLALVVCAGVIIAITGLNPLEVYQYIVSGAVGNKRRIWVTVRDSMLLLITAVALAPAFKMRFWNIGAEGQILAGALATAALMIYGGETIPAWLLFPLMFVCSAVCGAVWGIIPAFFKAFWDTNETLFTLMMNYVAMQVVNYSIVFWENPKGSNTVGTINRTTKAGWLPSLFGSDYGWIVVVALAFTVLMYVYLNYTKHGYEIAVVGESENTARYAGISVPKVIMRTMALSGAVCGIAGFLVVSGASHTISTSTAGGRGFTAIMVAWMAKFNTFVMIIIAVFLVFMQNGAGEVASKLNLNENFSEIITGIILFFIIGCEFFINYQIKFTSRKGGRRK